MAIACRLQGLTCPSTWFDFGSFFSWLFFTAFICCFFYDLIIIAIVVVFICSARHKKKTFLSWFPRCDFQFSFLSIHSEIQAQTPSNDLKHENLKKNNEWKKRKHASTRRSIIQTEWQNFNEIQMMKNNKIEKEKKLKNQLPMHNWFEYFILTLYILYACIFLRTQPISPVE